MKKLLSDCCQSPVHVSGGTVDLTHFYVCDKCLQACDAHEEKEAEMMICPRWKTCRRCDDERIPHKLSECCEGRNGCPTCIPIPPKEVNKKLNRVIDECVGIVDKLVTRMINDNLGTYTNQVVEEAIAKIQALKNK